MTAGTYRVVLLLYLAYGLNDDLSLVLRMDIWRHGTSRRRSLSMLQTIDSKVSAHELQRILQ
jgi:hypothetical protein